MIKSGAVDHPLSLQQFVITKYYVAIVLSDPVAPKSPEAFRSQQENTQGSHVVLLQLQCVILFSCSQQDTLPKSLFIEQQNFYRRITINSFHQMGICSEILLQGYKSSYLLE